MSKEIIESVVQAIQKKELTKLKETLEQLSPEIKKEILEGERNGMTLLGNAILPCYLDGEIVEYLIKQGADPNKMLHNKCFLLHITILKGHLASAKALINNGADINVKNQGEDVLGMKFVNAMSGRTALHFAIQLYNDYKEELKENAKNYDECLAKTDQAIQFVKFLVNKDADLTAKGGGKTPLDIAKKRSDNRELIEFLENAYASQEKKKDASEKSDLTNKQQDNTQEQSISLCPRKLAVIAVAAISCALALYFLAPLIIGSAAGVGAQLALGAIGAVIGGGIGYLTNVAIDKFCGNKVAEQIV